MVWEDGGGNAPSYPIAAVGTADSRYFASVYLDVDVFASRRHTPRIQPPRFRPAMNCLSHACGVPWTTQRIGKAHLLFATAAMIAGVWLASSVTVAQAPNSKHHRHDGEIGLAVVAQAGDNGVASAEQQPPLGVERNGKRAVEG